MFALALSSCGDDDDDNDDNDDNSGNEVEGTAADIIVAAHNEFRTAVGVDDIVWSEDLAKSAQEWADQLAVNCDFEHSSSGFGENIWLGSTGFFTPKRCGRKLGV